MRVGVVAVLCGMTLAACAVGGAAPQPSAQPTPGAVVYESVPFEVIAAADPPVSTAKVAYSAAFAVTNPATPDEVLKDVLPNLPDQAQQELHQALGKAADKGTLYVVVFAGQQPSAGYRVSVDAVQRQAGKLVVQYHAVKPDPQQAHAEVITFPYAIVRIPNAGSDPADVRFENKPQ